MKSVKLQLLVTLVAVGVVVGVFAARGPPPETGIFRGASRDDVEAIWRSLRWGVDVNARQTDRWPAHEGWTPLLLAVRNCQVKAEAFLISEGADINAKGHNGLTPLHNAADYGRNLKRQLSFQ